MPPTPSLREKPRRRKRSGQNAGIDLLYSAINAPDEAAVDLLVETETASAILPFYRTGWQLEEKGGGVWDVTVSYGLREPIEQSNGSEYAFDTSGGTQRSTQSLATVGAFPSANHPIVSGNSTFSRAVGVTRDGNRLNVEGADTIVPVFRYTETHYIDASVVTASYVRALFALTGSVNDADFKGFVAGEALFTGARGQRRGSEQWRIDFSWDCLPNRSGFSIGEITGISKKGWDYMWILYEEYENTTLKLIGTRPSAVFVEQMYPYGNFTLLGIGT